MSTEKQMTATASPETSTSPSLPHRVAAEALPLELGQDHESQIGKDAKPAETGKPDADTIEYVTGIKLGIVCASVALACFLMLVDTMVVSTAIPRITDQFNSLPDVGWYASAYQFGSAAPQPLTGKVYTHFNTKWSFLAFFGIFELGSLLCGAAVSSSMLIVGRAIAGLGGAGIINGAITIVSSCTPFEKRPALIGLIAGINQLGLVVGPLIGGAFTSYSTWRWAFYINLPIGAVAAIAIVFLRIPELAPKQKATMVLLKLHHYLDLVGFILFAPAILMLLLALQWGGNEFAWNSSRVIGLFCGAAANFVIWFLWNHHKGENALIPPSMVAQRTVWASALYQAFLMAAVFGAVFFLPIYFQAIKNANAMQSGLYLLPMILPQLLMAGASGLLVTKIGYVIPPAIFGTVLLSIGSGLYSILQPSSSTGQWVGFQIISGVGSGASLQMSMIAIQAAVTGEQLPSAMAFLVFAQSMGPAIILAACNVIFDASLRSQLQQQAPNVDAAAIIKAGATGFRAIVQPGELPGVLKAYANSLDRVFYLVAASAATCGIALWGMGWQDLRKERSGKEANGAGEESGQEKNDPGDEVKGT